MTNESSNEEADAAGDTTPDDKANLGDLGDVSHPFDQTNGIVDGLEGNSDGQAEENTSDSTKSDVDASRPGDESDEGGNVTGPIPPTPMH
ncbi:hypothetical protein [Glaciibacter superstes]|uniref:hypothetical protein n=1 Tax=Glaciibacter superstes TaxID=501023 RepID=UPI0003B6D785|nr:hypothetical protein [Glaciibacter superstes]